ncbi:hypothetical protein [Globicatella sanguinis]
MTCLIPTQLCGGGQTKRKSPDFLRLAHSLLPILFSYPNNTVCGTMYHD